MDFVEGRVEDVVGDGDVVVVVEVEPLVEGLVELAAGVVVGVAVEPGRVGDEIE
ncbi:hypothetical protein [Jatrophihabitans lederbergiae]|uniref:Uncharacterized protein n=1 Tax=Jatrophihabitans lederbergiae TaxID=3075547 RepID=A0ABU2J940_9ACTN|nr:hypothetical protein [Jatrophihabitans sp. DSM 44399]MDT0261472.1 hypothetical protein [Jatrophihabitans sp. DSM 44399]